MTGLLSSSAVQAAVENTSPPTGEQARQYHFDSANMDQDYRIYVPKNYDPAKRYPLVIDLHGVNANPDTDFKGGELANAAQKYGFIVVAPKGIGEDPMFWGSIYPFKLADPDIDPARDMRPLPADQQYYAKDIPGLSSVMFAMSAPEAEQKRLWSEQDALNVLALTQREYNIDPDRIYLLGNSAGAGGVLYLAAKYADKWAAIAPVNGVVAPWSYPVSRLEDVPLLFVHGSEDKIASSQAIQAIIDGVNAQGGEARLLRVAGGKHADTWYMALDDIFSFFAQHKRADNS
ncbi:carboxylesterase family protein [Phytohalomonas tamaricis]|uniref:carboxylesterase family protein n=1 Tax=Phytohalomonas tamaricis TaxID=2081032 RepID=UPI00131A1809|nr:hypothetical protein [Phytohalomonas tamaricis]